MRLILYGSDRHVNDGEMGNWKYVGVVFGSMLGAQAEKLKIVFFMFVWILSLCYVLSSVAFLAAWPAAPRTCKNLKIHRSCGSKNHMRLFLAAPEASKNQRTRVAKH